MFNPFKKVTQKVEEKATMTGISVLIGLLIRHLLGAIGMQELLPDFEIDKLTAALITIGVIAWSAYQKYSQMKRSK